jgi:iron complex outermembrane receptor protein
MNEVTDVPAILALNESKGLIRFRGPLSSLDSFKARITVYARSIAILIILGAVRIFAQNPPPASDLASISLEDLMNIEVTTSSKKGEKLFQTAASIYVITGEEIRHSGLTSIPELLRLAPGMEVARIDGNKWAISARGYSGRFANRLLVLIDGRSIYSPDTGGVYWEAQHLPVEEIDRIEVIRGPGGTLWGANAVDGIINIITKSSSETQGGLITTGGGSEEQGFGSARYGGQIGERLFYRIYTRYFKRRGLVDAMGVNVNDGQHAVQGGFRLDWRWSERDTLIVHGDLYDTALRETPTTVSFNDPFAPPANVPGEFSGGNFMGRWNRVLSERSDMALQFYFDRARRESANVGNRIDTFDFDFQHRLTLGRRQEIVWGLGYRLIADQSNTNNGAPIELIPKGRTAQIFSAFAQDELMLVKNRLRLIVGSKLEHNDYSGFEWQPSVRLLWTPSAHHTVWAAVTRAVRTPARIYQGIRVNYAAFPGPDGLPIIATIIGNRNTKPERFRNFELGARAQAGNRLTLDITTFYTVYNHLTAFEQGPIFFEAEPQPHLVYPLLFNNRMRGESYGLEASANLNLTHRWKVRGGYSFARPDFRNDLEDPIATVAEVEGGIPRHQFQLHSHLKLFGNFELDNSLYRVSRLPAPQIPGYTRLDLRLGWRVGEKLELSLGLQNLLDDRHPEFNGFDLLALTSQVKRSIYGKATWRF